MGSVSAAFERRKKYTHFRILVIGRANAGKTTLLKRVCNTTDDPRIYDDGKNLVRFVSHCRSRSYFNSTRQSDRANRRGMHLILTRDDLSEPVAAR